MVWLTHDKICSNSAEERNLSKVLAGSLGWTSIILAAM
jgi:hypothetical protein